ncbi:hypothetical protein DPMN_077799 [Dreissena polymorpha]|uniref:Uncharacterized protein n=1 Tax=Dreissena polymorpha TaxID=45954 RepID=A0A9D3YL46_DREPO|nr:hypothetical protein DPMN_077799 [Dreissena polymorpha]
MSKYLKLFLGVAERIYNSWEVTFARRRFNDTDMCPCLNVCHICVELTHVRGDADSLVCLCGAPVKADSVPAEPRYTVTPPALTEAKPASDPGRATATPRFNPGRRRYTGTLPAFTGVPPEHQRRQPGSVGVALPGSVWAPVELRRRDGCSRCRPGCSRCRAGRCRSLPVTPGSSRRYKTDLHLHGGAPVVPGRLRFIPVYPVEPRFIPVEPGSSR